MDLGTVDDVDGNRVEPRRSDPASGGQRHRDAQEAVASVDGNTVRLGVPADRARRSWRGEAVSPEKG